MPAIVIETIALNATVEPMLMSPMQAEIMAQRPMDRRGSAVHLSTRDRKPQQGSPLSRTKAQVYREAPARKPKDAQTVKAMRIAVMTGDPAGEYVVPKNT